MRWLSFSPANLKNPGTDNYSKSASQCGFCDFPKAIIPVVQEKCYFYVWNERTSEVRLMTSFDYHQKRNKKFGYCDQRCLETPPGLNLVAYKQSGFSRTRLLQSSAKNKSKISPLSSLFGNDISALVHERDSLWPISF